LGRKYIAIDIDPRYVEITKENLEANNPTKINGCYVSTYLGKIATVRDKDWEEIKHALIVPEKVREVELEEIKIRRAIPAKTLIEYGVRT